MSQRSEVTERQKVHLDVGHRELGDGEAVGSESTERQKVH